MFMKRIIIILILFFVYASAQIPNDVLQRKGRYGFKVNRRPPVNFNVFADYNEEGWLPQIHISVSVLNDVLSFEKKEQKYEAQYQVNAALLKNDKAVLSESWSETVILNRFKETNARDRYQYSKYLFSNLYPRGSKKLEHGKYEIFVEVRDLNSKKTLTEKKRRKFKIQPPDSIYDLEQATLRSSEIAILKTDQIQNENPLPLTANGKTLLYNHPAYGYVHFHPSDSRTVPEFNIRIYKEEKGDRLLIYQTYKTVAQNDTTNRMVFPLPIDSLEEGNYKLRVTGASDRVRLSLNKEFDMVWFEKPVYLYRTDLAVRPMVYLLPEKEFEEVKDKNLEELKKWFKAYWKKKDPNPETVYNVLLHTFYERVDRANRKFNKPYKEGWETDRGKIYILYGAPDEVENNRYVANGKPHIIWKYNSLNKTFIFVDENKDDEFQLIDEQKKEP